jgi:hypothetical protein
MDDFVSFRAKVANILLNLIVALFFSSSLGLTCGLENDYTMHGLRKRMRCVVPKGELT